MTCTQLTHPRLSKYFGCTKSWLAQLYSTTEALNRVTAESLFSAISFPLCHPPEDTIEQPIAREEVVFAIKL